MSVSLNISINNDSDPSFGFLPNQTIKGTFTINVPIGIVLEVSGIYLQFRGFERVRFRLQQRADINHEDDIDLKPLHHDINISTGIPTILPISQPHFLQKVLTSLTIPISRLRGKLLTGLHSFQFDFKIEGKLPPSIEFGSRTSKYSASIEYEIFVQVFCKNINSLSLTKPVKIKNLIKKCHLSSFHEETLKIKKSFTFGCFLFGFCGFSCVRGIRSQSDFSLKADWKQNSFSTGDTVKFIFNLKSVDFDGILSVKLVRELFLFIDDRSSFRKIDPIAKSKIIFEASHDWSIGTTHLSIPVGLDPTIKTKAIDCRYFFVFEIKLKEHEPILTSSELFIY